MPRNLISFPLGGETVLLDERGGELYVLNSTASRVWHALRAGKGVEATALELAEETRAPLDQVRRDVSRLVDQWLDPQTVDSSTMPDSAPRSPYNRALARQATSECGPDGFARTYKLLDFSFRVKGNAEFERACGYQLGHLERFDDTDSVPLPVFGIDRVERGWRLSLNGQTLGECDDDNELIPMLHAHTLVASYEQSTSLAVVHAGAVATESGAILMPATSGSGKSTLTAALVAAGFGYYSDDLAVLTPTPIRLRPAPVAIGLKTNSWRVLRPFAPNLEACAVHRRQDGQEIRYLVPPGDRLPDAGSETLRVCTIVFPKYRAGAQTELVQISRGEALLRLAKAGYDTRARIDREWVAAVLDWLMQLPCYELHFDDLSDAVAAVERIVQ